MRLFSIEEDRLLELLKAENVLQALNCAGVDNWDGCDFSSEFQDLELQGSTEVLDYYIEDGIELLED